MSAEGGVVQAGAVLGGRYRLIEPIGAGGFGQVRKAHDPNVDRMLAVKVLTGDADDRQVARFARGLQSPTGSLTRTPSPFMTSVPRRRMTGRGVSTP